MEECYQCIDSDKCYASHYLQNCRNTKQSYYCNNCLNCTNCLFCTNLVNASSYLLNKPVSPTKIMEVMNEIYQGG